MGARHLSRQAGNADESEDDGRIPRSGGRGWMNRIGKVAVGSTSQAPRVAPRADLGLVIPAEWRRHS